MKKLVTVRIVGHAQIEVDVDEDLDDDDIDIGEDDETLKSMMTIIETEITNVEVV